MAQICEKPLPHPHPLPRTLPTPPFHEATFCTSCFHTFGLLFLCKNSVSGLRRRWEFLNEVQFHVINCSTFTPPPPPPPSPTIHISLWEAKIYHLMVLMWGKCCSGGSRGGVRGPRVPPPLIFRPNWGPRGQKRFWRLPHPPVSGSGWPPPAYLKVCIQHLVVGNKAKFG